MRHCDNCETDIQGLRRYKSHLTTHTEVQTPFACPACHKVRRRSLVKRHPLTATDSSNRRASVESSTFVVTSRNSTLSFLDTRLRTSEATSTRECETIPKTQDTANQGCKRSQLASSLLYLYCTFIEVSCLHAKSRSSGQSGGGSGRLVTVRRK